MSNVASCRRVLTKKPRALPSEAGNITVMSAIMMTVLVGMLGLALDLGYNYNQRRTMQNAADAAALKGASVIQQQGTTTLSDVTSFAKQNRLPDPAVAGSGGALTCEYVNDSSVVISACTNAKPPTNATGVKVTVSEQHPTFLMRALQIANSGTGATATAHVKVVNVFTAKDGPILVCGIDTIVDSTGNKLSILTKDASNNYIINPAAIGQTFLIHGPQVAGCKTQGNGFKGVNDQDANTGVTGSTINYSTGNQSGPMRRKVQGVNGCDLVQTTGCVMILPIIDDANVSGCSTGKCVHLVGYAAFFVTETASNKHTGKLVSPYQLQESGNFGWTPQTTGPSSISMTK